MSEKYVLGNTDQSDENSDLFEHFRFVVDRGQTPVRIDVFLTNRIEHVSRNKIQQTAAAGNILVNQVAVKANYKVKPNDTIVIVLSYPPREVVISPEDIPLNVVYEDESLMVINKQADLVVHPGHGNFTGTLLHGLAHYFEKSGQKVENGFGYLVHRIDKDTTGLLLIAKDEFAQSKLAAQFFRHSIDRRYLALVWGDLVEDEGTIEGNIGRSPKDRKLMAVFPEGDSGKEAITHYTVVQRFGYVTLVECKLETGRTHQIRVHFKHIGHPLFNDPWYSGDSMIKGTTFTKYKQFIDNCFKVLPRHALHAQSIGFDHPLSGKKMHFESALPDDMQQVIEKWKVYTGSRQSETD